MKPTTSADNSDFNKISELDKSDLTPEQIKRGIENGYYSIINGITKVGTIALLRQLTTPLPTVWVSGYHTIGDGAFGSNIFEWDSTSTETDNGGTIIKLTSITTGRYKLKFSGTVNVKWFGDCENNTLLFQEVIDYCKDNSLNIKTDKTIFNLSETLYVFGIMLDFSGSTINYNNEDDTWAVVISALGDKMYQQGATNFIVNCTSTNTTNRTHGVCVGGVGTFVRDVRVRGFTGVSFGMGGKGGYNTSGVEDITGVTFEGFGQAYYADISNINIVSTEGWQFVIAKYNNANKISNISTFPLNGFGDSIPRRASCINSIVVNGIANVFNRVSLESAPSSYTVYFCSGSNQNLIDSLYIEHNTSWAETSDAVVYASTESSGNRIDNIRSTLQRVTSDDNGVGNVFNKGLNYYINGSQKAEILGRRNLITNGTFTGGARTGWSMYGTSITESFGTGYLSGYSWRQDVGDNGRPSFYQDVSTIGGYNKLAFLKNNITVSMWVRTNIPNLQIRIGSYTNSVIIHDSEWRYIQSTVKSIANAGVVHVITGGNIGIGTTGFVEISDVEIYLGVK